MDKNLIFAKTPIGDEAVRQSTRVVQRNLRMVLVQVDGKMSVEELAAKIGDQRLVETALRELEEGGYIAPTLEAVSVWQESKQRARKLKSLGLPVGSALPESPFSALETRTAGSAGSNFSSFGKPVFPAGTQQTQAPPPPHEPVAPGRRLSVISGAAISLVTVLLLALLAVLLFPFSRFKPAIEAELTRVWQAPVSVADVRLTLLPQPVLHISNVRISGGSGDSAIDEVRVLSPHSLLGSGVHVLDEVEVSGARLPLDQLLGLPLFAERAGKAPSLIVRRLRVEGMSLSAGTMTLSDIKGHIGFRGDGLLENAAFQTVDRSLRIEAQPTVHGLLLKIDGLGWRPSDESPLTFDSIQAKGLLQKGKLVVHNFDATALGGVVRGNWLVDWSNGLAMAGDATLERLDCRRVTSTFVSSLWLEGYLNGALRLRGAGRDWQSMWAGVEAILNADVMRGVLNGVDLGEAARRGAGSIVRAGSTKFDRLSVLISVSPQQVVGRDLVMNAGLFNATGQFVATRERQVDSTLMISMQTAASVLRLPVRVSGTLPNLQAVSGR